MKLLPPVALLLIAVSGSFASHAGNSTAANGTAAPPGNGTTATPKNESFEVAEAFRLPYRNMLSGGAPILRELGKKIGLWGNDDVTFFIPLGRKAWDVFNVGFKAGYNYQRVEDWTTKNLKTHVSWVSNLVKDGLGSVAGYSSSKKLIFMNKRSSPVKKWQGFKLRQANHCPGEPTRITDHSDKGLNFEFNFDPASPFAFVSYTTKHLGMRILNCHGIYENHGHLETLTPNGYTLKDLEAGFTFPVVHLTINRTMLNDTCEVEICAARRAGIPDQQGFAELRLNRHLILLTPVLKHSNGRHLLSVTPRIEAVHCTSGTRFITAIKHSVHTVDNSVPGPYKSFCNGTKYREGYAPAHLGCYSVSRRIAKVQCPTTLAHTDHNRGGCSISSHAVACEPGHICLTVSTPFKGIVKVSTERSSEAQDCIKECSFKVKGSEAVVTCPNGHKRRLESNRVETECPLSNYGHLPHMVCQLTFRPKVAYAWAIWLFVGYAFCRAIIYIIWFLAFLTAKLLRAIRVRMDSERGYCIICETWMESSFHAQRHEKCRNGRCAFCDLAGSKEKLITHAKTCIRREKCMEEDSDVATIRLVPLCFRLMLVCLGSFNKLTSRCAWLVVTVTLLYFMVHPVYALKQTAHDEDLWEEEQSFVDFCDLSCLQQEVDCVCNADFKVRNLLAFEDRLDMANRTMRSNKDKSVGPSSRRRIIDVTAPWGTLNIDSSFRPSYSSNHISLSWSDVQTTDTHVTIQGKSEAIVKLEPKTGLMWEISSPKSSEVRRVFLSILDFTQEYSTKFIYATGDRTVDDWMHGECTGNCPPRCGCNSKLCMHSDHTGFSNWRCNPSWCWSIGQGCVCCAISVKEFFKDWLVTSWETEYLGTKVIACLETSPEDRVCDIVGAGSQLQIDSISVLFSDPTGVTTKLPKAVAAFHKHPSMDEFDASKTLKLVDARTLCDIESCTHGPAGDFQMFRIDSLVYRDHISLNSADIRESIHQHSWMSWAGTSSYYNCHPYHWPTCQQNNVVRHNSEAFQNLWNLESLSDLFLFHREDIVVDLETPTLDIKGRPSRGAGQITALLNVNGLRLKSKRVRPEGVRITLGTCSGCYGCLLGFTCRVTARIDSPDEYTLHLKSLTTGVVVPSSSLLVTKSTDKTYELKFFSPVPVKKLCVGVEEGNEESSTSCAPVHLEAPKEPLLEGRMVLHSTSNATCSDGYLTCIRTNIADFFRGLPKIVTAIFGNWWMGITTVIIVVVVIVLLVFFGPSFVRIFTGCFKVCGIRRGTRRTIAYAKLREEYDAAAKELKAERERSWEARNLIKRFNKLA